MTKCEWPSCARQTYGGHKLCYYHRKVRLNGFMDLKDRKIYMPNKQEQEFAAITDKAEIDVSALHAKLEHPIIAEIMKLSLFHVCKKTKQPKKNFVGDIAILAMLHLTLPDEIQDVQKFVRSQATKFTGIIMNQYRKETEHFRYEIPIDCVSNKLLCQSPESVIIAEQEEANLARAVYNAKKHMTKIERKVFCCFENGHDAVYAQNRFKLSRQRVNWLKQSACKKVKEAQ